MSCCDMAVWQYFADVSYEGYDANNTKMQALFGGCNCM